MQRNRNKDNSIWLILISWSAIICCVLIEFFCSIQLVRSCLEYTKIGELYEVNGVITDYEDHFSDLGRATFHEYFYTISFQDKDGNECNIKKSVKEKPNLHQKTFFYDGVNIYEHDKSWYKDSISKSTKTCIITLLILVAAIYLAIMMWK